MIHSMALVAERQHNKHGSFVFIRDGVKVNNIEENVELIIVEIPGVPVHSMYKPPPEPFRLLALGQRKKASHRNVHCGDTPQLTTTENL